MTDNIYLSQEEIYNLYNILETHSFKQSTDNYLYDGTYPSKYKNVSKLDDSVIRMKESGIMPDKAKSKINKERKDHPPELINLELCAF
jgi:hypothetical protein